MPRSEDAQCAYNVQRRVQRAVDRIDSRMLVVECDGTLFERPALDVSYRRLEDQNGVTYVVPDDTVPESAQQANLMRLFHVLEDKGLPVKYADRDSGANYPCLEVALDEEYHRQFMTTIAAAVYEQGEEAVLPIVKRLGVHL